MKKINWKVRAKNPWFWIGLIGMFFCAIGVDSSTITSWKLLGDSLLDFINNPYLIVSVIVAFLGYIQDPTTKGLGDSERAIGYDVPSDGKVDEDEPVNFMEDEVE